LHVFGGGSTSRWQPARQHWQLALDSRGLAGDVDDWKQMPDLPFDGGAHGNDLHYGGHLYVFGQVMRDQGRFDNGTISMHQQNLKTIEASGFELFAGGRLLWFRTPLSQLDQPDAWQELPPMKQRVANSAFVLIGNELWVFGGRVDSMLRHDSILDSPAVQVFNLDTLEWRRHRNDLPHGLKSAVATFRVASQLLTLIDVSTLRIARAQFRVLDRVQHVDAYNKQQQRQWPTLRLRQCLSIDDPLVVWRTSSSFLEHAFGINKAWHARGSWPLVIVFIQSSKSDYHW
jgi:hypothetical protein